MAVLDTSLCCVPLVHMSGIYDVGAVVDLVVGPQHLVVDLVVGPQHLVADQLGGLDNFVCCAQISCIWYST